MERHAAASGGAEMKQVIVGVDRNESSQRAARVAAEYARALGANLHLVTVLHSSSATQTVSGAGMTFHDDPLAESSVYLCDVAGELKAPSTSVAVVVGDPASALVAEAERLGASLLVVGNRRVQGPSRVLGSVAVSVLRAAECDVLVAHTID